MPRMFACWCSQAAVSSSVDGSIDISPSGVQLTGHSERPHAGLFFCLFPPILGLGLTLALGCVPLT